MPHTARDAEYAQNVVRACAGQIVYHGPRTEVLPFFASCGFRPPVRKATPDFLQEVTSQKDQKVSSSLPSP